MKGQLVCGKNFKAKIYWFSWQAYLNIADDLLYFLKNILNYSCLNYHSPFCQCYLKIFQNGLLLIKRQSLPYHQWFMLQVQLKILKDFYNSLKCCLTSPNFRLILATMCLIGMRNLFFLAQSYFCKEEECEEYQVIFRNVYVTNFLQIWCVCRGHKIR